MMSTKKQKFAPVMGHIDKLDTIIIHHKRRHQDTTSVTYTVIPDQEDGKDIISVSCADDADVAKEETNNTPKQGDVSIFLRDEHDILLLDVKLTKLRCNRRIMKIDSPNGIQLGYVKKGRFSAYEICDANHHSLFHIDMQSKNHEYMSEVKNTRNGNKIAVIKQRQIDSDMLSFQINYKAALTTLQKVLIMVAGISEIQEQQETHLFSLARCLLIPKYFIVSVIYIIIGLFSIVLYTFVLIDALFFLAFIIIAYLKDKGRKIDEEIEKWGNCIGIMSTIPCIIYRNLNEFFDIYQ
ncbi:uncharacterized protein LOC143074369 [Mytilus galloprovincialis]|uniref:uncharacterized protein LOC143074369 n=1 Tax=Mytilus galloprovincialis TaxID=29158 RepID=UPI003F7C0C68